MHTLDELVREGGVRQGELRARVDAVLYDLEDKLLSLLGIANIWRESVRIPSPERTRKTATHSPRTIAPFPSSDDAASRPVPSHAPRTRS